MNVPTPTLRPIDLALAERHEHPDIRTDGTVYLVWYRGRFHSGTFSRQHYGLNFNAVYPAGAQFDAPGFNHSDWEAVWEIVP